MTAIPQIAPRRNTATGFFCNERIAAGDFLKLKVDPIFLLVSDNL